MSTADAVRIDADRLREMTSGCGWTLAEFADFYAPRARDEIAAIAAAAEAGDSATVTRLAHGAAGSSASVGMTSLSRRYRAIEEREPSTSDDALGDLIGAARAHLALALRRLEELARPAG